MKQTAVDWLIDMVEDNIGLIPTHIIEKAKEMEKEQIREAFAVGKWDAKDLDIDSNKYYQETYEKDA